MTTRVLAALALAAMLGLNATAPAADDPKLPDVKAFDKLVIDSLRQVHNKGADLYNTAKDFPAAYRLYQGALETVKPLLAHRPEAQKLIETGLADADKETDTARKAFLLHQTIEAVRKQLKVANGLQNKEPEKKDSVEKKQLPEVGVAPEPKAQGDGRASLSGHVTLQGKPLAAGEVKLVAVKFVVPRVFAAEVKDGDYTFAGAIPAGKYTVLVTGGGVPAQYALPGTSALRIELAAGRNAHDLDLK